MTSGFTLHPNLVLVSFIAPLESYPTEARWPEAIAPFEANYPYRRSSRSLRRHKARSGI
jgi:hypothetical protein